MAVSGTVPTELGDKKIRDLLMQYAVPAIIAMTASSLYNMVDSIFIGHIKDVGSYAISGLAVTFPLMNISTSAGTEKLSGRQQGDYKRGDAECNHRYLVYRHYSCIPGSYSDVFWGQREYVALCKGLYGDNPNWKCHNSFVLRTEQYHQGFR